jgi:hypothetical protein
MVSVEGQPICTGAQVRTGCGADADCQRFGADAVCIATVSGSDECDFGENFCATPCPAH